MPDKKEPVEVICPKCQHTQIIYLKREDIPKCSECDRSMVMREFLRKGANFKTSPFVQYLRQAKILILEILHVFLWLKFSPSLILNKIEHFETASRGSHISLRLNCRVFAAI